MDRIVDFLMDNVSNLSFVCNITNTLGSMHEKIHHMTLGNYIQYLCNAFTYYKVRKYDIKGKEYLSSSDKYFLFILYRCCQKEEYNIKNLLTNSYSHQCKSFLLSQTINGAFSSNVFIFKSAIIKLALLLECKNRVK